MKMDLKADVYGPAKVDPNDRAAILDALYRFAAGYDFRDRELFASAFSEKATLDITGPARRLGAALPVLEGRDMIVGVIMASAEQVDTTHSVTNPRILSYDGKRARLSALVEANNLPRGDHSRNLLLKNLFTADLSKQDRHWVIDNLLIENLWLTGDPEVLFPKP